MEIPNSENVYCEGCPFYHWEEEVVDDCSNPQLKTEDVYGGQRTGECLAAYPYGGTVTITAKEKG